MQTFLPLPSFTDSARCLDNKRLGKQRVECKQIYLALTDPAYGWKNHPAVKMWTGHVDSLAVYGHIICIQWRKRGFQDTLEPWFFDRLSTTSMSVAPHWMGDPDFHASHRSNLLRKDPVWYGQWGWTEPHDLPYVWPKPTVVTSLPVGTYA